MKVLIVDDHPLLFEGIAAVLRQAGPDTIVLWASDAARALTFAAEHSDLDLIVLDLVLPGMSGLPALAEFGRVRPDVPVIVLSSSENPEDAREAFARGALGYVPKSASHHTLLSAIRLVLDGDRYVPPLILAESQPLSIQTAAGGSPLTARQIDVLRPLSDGKSNRQIALELGLSEKTVKAHVTAIFKSLNVVNRTQAAAVGRAAGLI
jgi:two-component system nitrate/nitrite response regulator NarL